MSASGDANGLETVLTYLPGPGPGHRCRTDRAECTQLGSPAQQPGMVLATVAIAILGGFFTPVNALPTTTSTEASIRLSCTSLAPGSLSAARCAPSNPDAPKRISATPRTDLPSGSLSTVAILNPCLCNA